MVSEEPRRWWADPRPWLWQLGLPLLGAAALVAGLLALGAGSRGWLRSGGAGVQRFADLECPAPPGMSRAEFLDEVQFRGSLADGIDVLDPEAEARVRAALLRHPWVKAVGAVELRRGVMRAEVTFREPVLLVKALGRNALGRVSDAEGQLLPHGAEVSGLLVWDGSPKEALPSVAGVAGALHPHREQLGIVGAALAMEKGEVSVLAGRSAVIRWGKPGAAGEKVRRLLDGERDVRNSSEP